jgi:DNA-binding GntR family transcriptional regulator
VKQRGDDSDEPFVIERASITDKVYGHIKELILAGYLKGGEKVPEERVAGRFKVSRTPIREALRRLERYGLIYIKPRSYAVVVELRPEEAGQIAVIRLSLEKLVAELLCAKDAAPDLDELRELSRRCSALIGRGRRAEAFEIDSRFHLLLARLTGNSHLYEIVEKLDAKVQLLRLKQDAATEELAGYIAQHEQIVGLIEKKDARGLEVLLRRHIMHDLPPNP